MTEYTEKFTGKVAEYARFRERYDAGIVLPMLRQWCGLKPEWAVADVGAGTGMTGDLFRANGNKVFAIEPNAEMRAECTAIHSDDELFAIVDGSAENTGLQAGSVEMIAVGRALHWFDVERTVKEFRRILKPGGWVTVLSCGRTEDGREENIAFKELMEACTGRDRLRDPRVEVYHRLESLFAGGQFHHGEADGEMQLDWAGLRGLTLSLSHAPMPGSAGFADFEKALRAYFDRYEQSGAVTMTTRSWVNAGQPPA